MPTTNPVPSTDPSDLLFNAGKLDEVVNGTANSFTDRLGVSRRTVAGMNADFDAQLADAESDLNVYRADAAASAAEALGYLQTIRATSYGAYASDPATDPLGNPPTVGDEYFNTTANLLKRWNGTTWQASDINTANLAASSGSSLVGYDNGTVQDVLDGAKSLQDYVELRAYTGRANRVYITGLLVTVKPAGIFGFFEHDPTDTTSADNGGTIIVGADGRRWKRDYSGEIFVTWFGAVGSGDVSTASINTVAINAAAEACAINSYDVGRGGPTLVFPQAIGYIVDGPITVKAGIPVEMRNTSILYGGSANITVLTIGEKSTRSFRNKLTGIDVRRTANSTWNNAEDIGICLLNQFFSEIEIRGARGFYIGARCQGVNPGEGFYYNRVSLGFFFGNAINLDLIGGDGVDAGWVNENLFIAGEFQNGTTNSYNRYGVRVSNSPPGALFNDNNLFIKPSFEMNGAAGNESVPFLILNSDGLTVLNARHEGANSTVFAQIRNDSKNTDIHVGHQRITESAIDDQSINKSTTVRNLKVNWQFAGKLIYETGSLGRLVCRYNSTRYHIPGLNFYRKSDTSLFNNSGPLASFSGDKIQVGATDAVARMINTERCKKFSVNIDSDSGQHPWIVVQCFDASGNVLTNAGAGHPYVSGPGMTWSASWNGYAYPGSVSSERLFTVSDDVKSVRVGIYNGYLRGFSIYAIGIDNQYAPTYSGYEDVVRGSNIGTQAPLDGTWSQGHIIFNATPSAGGSIGWVCVSGGTPGTWKTFGAISS